MQVSLDVADPVVSPKRASLVRNEVSEDGWGQSQIPDHLTSVRSSHIEHVVSQLLSHGLTMPAGTAGHSWTYWMHHIRAETPASLHLIVPYVTPTHFHTETLLFSKDPVAV